MLLSGFRLEILIKMFAILIGLDFLLKLTKLKIELNYSGYIFL